MNGHFVKRKNGSYQLVVSDGTDELGKRIRHTKTIKASNDKEAQKQLNKFIRELEEGKLVLNKNTLEQFLNDWMKECCELTLAPTTIAGYKRTIKNHIVPHIGDTKLENLNTLLLQKYINKLYANGIGERTVKFCKQILSSSFSWGCSMGKMADNPCKNVRLKRQEKEEKVYLDEEDFQKLLVALNNESPKYQAICMLAILTGCRRGEILALKWSDIDPENKVMHVRRSVQYLKEKGVFIKEPKTKSSIRVISLPELAFTYLDKYKAYQNEQRLKMGDKWSNEEGYIFTNAYGGLLNPSSKISNWFKSFVEKNNLPKIVFHDLRHFHTSFLLMNGLDVKSVSRRLGHSSTAMTLNVYAHVFKSSDRAAADLMDNLLVKKSNTIAK